MDWLADKGSMTKNLKQASKQELRVELLQSSEMVPHPSELSVLKLPASTPVYVREVLMSVAEDKWMYGRSVMPLATVSGVGSDLKQLGTEPLGSLLFDKNISERVLMEVALITSEHYLYPKDELQKPSTLWARRSIFMFHNQPLLVQEVFLPKSPIGSV